MITRPPESIIKAIIRTSRCGHHELRVRNVVLCMGSVIIALITHTDGRTLRSPGILDDHKAAGVDYHNDSQMSHNHSTAFPKRYQESEVKCQILPS